MKYGISPQKNRASAPLPNFCLKGGTKMNTLRDLILIYLLNAIVDVKWYHIIFLLIAILVDNQETIERIVKKDDA